MVKIIFNKIGLILAVFGLVFLVGLFLAENSSAKIENSVSATAVSGGNTVTDGGTIKTGDATATVSAENYVNSGENTQNRVEARAEVQGEGAHASVEVNGEQKSCVADDEEGCAVEINQPADDANDANKADVADDADKNFIQSIANSVANFTKSITEKIISWFF